MYTAKEPYVYGKRDLLKLAVLSCQLLLDSGAEIDAKDTYWTALHNASRSLLL